MTSRDRIEQLRLACQARGFWTHGFSFPRKAAQVFGELDLAGKNVLEIGCGRGHYCLWAGIHGAARVVGLEPVADGSRDADTFFTNFAELARKLGLENARMAPVPVQEYVAPEGSVDCVLSFASINHLDEDACIRLRQDPAAWERYAELFRGIRRMMKTGGSLVIIDAQPRNLFADIGLKNPFHPHVEWFKHQAPETWAALMAEAGFGQARITWLSDLRLLRLGITHIPRALSYCTDSMFRLQMSAV